MNKILTWIIVLIVIVAGFFVLSKKSVPTSTGPFKVGVILPLTGDAASYGEVMRNIYQLAIKEVNDAGGVNGNKIELIIEDGKCDGTGGASAAQKLVNVDKVKVILGGFCSSESLAAVPIVESAKVALFSSGSSNPGLTGKSRFFARNFPGDSAQGKVLANIAKSQGAKSIYILVEQTDYAKGIADALKSSFTNLGGTVVTEEFASDVTDLRQLVTKAKAANPDIFMMSVQTPTTGQKILKAMRDLSWKPKLFVNDVIPGDPATMSIYKDIMNGAYTAEVGSDPTNPIFKHALDAYKTTYVTDMSFQSYGQIVYDAPFIIRDAIKDVGYDGEKIADWLHKIKDWKGAAGSLTIGSDGDPLVGHRAEIIKDGKVEVLK